jgi:hypothetical protein
LNWLLIVAIDSPGPGNDVLEGICFALMFGSLFGHTTVAAAWAAFGPGRLLLRVPLSLLWVALLALAIGVNIDIHGGPSNTAFMFGVLLLMQWILLQIPFGDWLSVKECICDTRRQRNKGWICAKGSSVYSSSSSSLR